MSSNYTANKNNYRQQNNYQQNKHNNNNNNNNNNNQRQITNNNDSLTITRNFNNSYNKNYHHNKNRNWDENRNQTQGVKKTIPGNMRERKEVPMAQQVKLALQIITKLGDFTQSDSSTVVDDVNLDDNVNNNHITDELLSNIKTTAEIFITVGDLDEYPQEIASLFVQCFSQLSVQIPIIATLLSLLHTDKPEFTQLVIAKLQERLMQAITDDDVMSAKLLLKSIACLASCKSFKVVGTGGIVNIIETLINVTKLDLENSVSLTPTGQAVAYLLASTLIWSANILHIQQQKAVLDSARELLHQIKLSWKSPYAKDNLQAVFINTVSFSNNEDEITDYDKDKQCISVGPYHHQQHQPQEVEIDSNSNNSFLEDQSCWDTLWETCNTALFVITSVSEESNSGYSYPTCMNVVWTGIITEATASNTNSELSFDATFANTFIAIHTPPQQQLSTQSNKSTIGFLGRNAIFCIPSKTCSYVIGSSCASTWLRARFTIFDIESSVDAAICCKELSILEKYQAFNYFQDILHFFDPIINEDGTKLGSMELLTSHLLAVFKLYPEHIHLEYILIEMLLQIIIQQPVNSTLNASVYRLILELCRKSPQVFPPVVALGANIIFQIVSDMDYSASTEFAKWFSFHLINTKLSWPYWEFWVQEYEDLTTSDTTTTTCMLPLFIRFVAEKCQIAVVADKVKVAFPEIFHNFIPTDQQPVYCGALLLSLTTTPSQHSDLVMDGSDGGEHHHSIFPQLNILRNEEKLSLNEIAIQLETLIDAKTSSDEIINWIDQLSLVTAVSEDSQSMSMFCWKGCLLMQVLLHKGTSRGKQLSALIGLLDRYSDAIRNFSTLEENQLDVLAILQEIFQHNSYMYHYCLNEMLRRGLLSVVAVARALCGEMLTSSPYYAVTHFSISLNHLDSDPTVFQCLESLIDRTLDFVNAAIAQRKLLGGEMLLDESLDLTAVDLDMPLTSTNREFQNESHINHNEDGDDDDDDDDDDNRHKRARRGDHPIGEADAVDGSSAHFQNDVHKDATISNTAVDTTIIDMMEHEIDPVWASEEAVKYALRNSRTVYGIVISSLVRGIQQTTNSSNKISNPMESAWSKVACSLIRRTIRVYHGLQQHLTQQYQQRVVISEPHSIPTQYLAQLHIHIPTTTTWSCHSL